MHEYAGGISDWLEHGGQVESTARRRRVRGDAPRAPAARRARPADRGRSRGPRRSVEDRLIDTLVLERSVGGLLAVWLAVVLAFGLVYWAADLAGAPWIDLDAGGRGSVADLLNAVYFSFVTALTIGYGDISPLGPARVLAVVEGALGLLIFGLVISKLVSRRQDELLEDTHRISFDQRLGRVRTNLHLVLSELQAIAKLCDDDDVAPAHIRTRAESTIAVFEGELRTVHDVLYRPHQMPDEQVLESILASLAANLEVLQYLLSRLPADGREPETFATSLRRIELRAQEICADCVPQEYAPHLSGWMDRVQTLAQRLA